MRSQDAGDIDAGETSAHRIDHQETLSHRSFPRATEVFGMVIAEVKRLQALPDLDPLKKGKVVAEFCSVAMQAIAVGEAHLKNFNNFMSPQNPR